MGREINELKIQNEPPYSVTVDLWGVKKKVEIEFCIDDLEVDDNFLYSIIPIIESRISFINEHRSKIEQVLIDDEGVDLAEEWASSAKSSEDEKDCYIMENGQKVYIPISEEFFRNSLHISGALIRFEDSLDNVETELYIYCDPDFFAGHGFYISIYNDNEIKSNGLFG
ncbi:hypothetical protein BCR32DRAFT_285945 [Anaeromyces robustus]|uniref:DUF2262 domain-containing protein n=1 Tax=Anaeromyces robustus TaxID=1754192 RepID=A0A1Y1WA62_9FUNG|nr:hypothetical protein BCR32DRAFT_285945 [Anaeromyces robustus]|eukprot:ORX70413.1 hypothetical protein BCR32DRAFT_285945 [Anaeromyces robustus]